MRRHTFHDLWIREAKVKTESLSSRVRSWLGSSDSGLGCCDHQGYCDHGNEKSANFSSNEVSENSRAWEKISGTISEEVENSVEFTPAHKLSSVKDNPRHDELVSRLPPPLREQMTTKINGVLQDVQWCVEDCDMLVQVEHTVFPVQRHFVAMVSEFFRHVADMMQQKHVTAVLGGFEGAEIEMVLKHIYNTNGAEITDSNVASLLQLALQFGVARLQHQCEMHLLHSTTFNMLIALQLARRYRLEKVMKHACQKLSLQEDFEETAEFASLDKSTQNLVLRFALQRYKQARSAIYDVYTCPRHRGNSKGVSSHGYLYDGVTSDDHSHEGLTSDGQLCDSGVLFDEKLRDGISSNDYSGNGISSNDYSVCGVSSNGYSRSQISNKNSIINNISHTLHENNKYDFEKQQSDDGKSNAYLSDICLTSNESNDGGDYNIGRFILNESSKNASTAKTTEDKLLTCNKEKLIENDNFQKSDKTMIKKDSNNEFCENIDPQNIGCSTDKDHVKLRNNSCCFRTTSYTLSDGCKEKISLLEIFHGAFQQTPHIEVEWT